MNKATQHASGSRKLSFWARALLALAALPLLALLFILGIKPAILLIGFGPESAYDWRGDPYWKRQFLLHHALEDAPTYALTRHDSHPAWGWTPKPDMRDGDTPETTNNKGYRATIPHTLRKDAFRVAVFGDSFTFE